MPIREDLTERQPFEVADVSPTSFRQLPEEVNREVRKAPAIHHCHVFTADTAPSKSDLMSKTAKTSNNL